MEISLFRRGKVRGRLDPRGGPGILLSPSGAKGGKVITGHDGAVSVESSTTAINAHTIPTPWRIVMDS